MFPEYRLDGRGSPGAYRRYDAGRDVNYYEADPDLRLVLDLYLDDAALPWADERLRALGGRCGTDFVRRADAYDRARHELVRYDRFGRDVSRIAYHPDWLASLDEVFDFGVVGWNHDPDLVALYGRAPVAPLTAFDYLVGQADMALCCPIELARGAVTVPERFADRHVAGRCDHGHSAGS